MMRHNAKRSSRGGRQQSNNNQNGKKPNRMKVFDSNGPDARIRGTAYQITEKYETLAKDAEASGNVVLAENYRQHAEHYQRIINSFVDETPVVQSKNDDADDQSEDDLGLPASITGQASVETEMVSA